LEQEKNSKITYDSMIQTLARGPHAARRQFLCSPRMLSVSRTLHEVIKTWY